MLEAITNQYMVLVRCLTFNQAAYIEDAMNGFCMQKTTFPFVCGIIDDASTDGEPDIIKNYLQLNFDLEDKTFVRNEETNDYVMTLARHKTNKNCSFVVFFLKYNHYRIKKAKLPYLERWYEKVNYIASCEGDDYWIDPLKLQKQVDFLESHNDYGLVYTNYKIHNQKNGNTIIANCIQTSFEDEITRNRIATLTTLTRLSLLKQYRIEIGKIPYERGWMMGDFPLWIFIMANSKAKLIPDITSVYRVFENSASHHTSFKKSKDFIFSTYNISFYFADKYKISSEIRKIIANNEITDLLLLAQKHNSSINFPLFAFMCKNKIFNPKYYLSAKLRLSVWGRKFICHIIAIRKSYL